jgi:RNA recognition motif-containing protein
MGNKIYVGNLPFKIGDKELNKIFSEFGAITEAVVIKDKYSKRSKGFGFVTFESDESAENAIASMNGKEVEGRALKVSESKPREESDRSY